MKTRKSFMNKFFVCVLILASWNSLLQGQVPPDSTPVATPPATSKAAPKYKLDPRQTSIVFAINHFKLSYLYGRFNRIAGDFRFQPSDIESSKFRFEIDTDSIDTNLKERDEHLKSEDFFDAKNYPRITFDSTEVLTTKTGFLIKGKMTILDTTRNVDIPARLVGVGKGPFGKERAGFFARFTIKRSEFGMKKMLPDVGDSIAITFSFEGIKQAEDEK